MDSRICPLNAFVQLLNGTYSAGGAPLRESALDQLTHRLAPAHALFGGESVHRFDSCWWHAHGQRREHTTRLGGATAASLLSGRSD